MKQLLLNGVALLAAVVMAGCTTKSQEAPPLAGPSEFGTSIVIAIAPDVLTQDGASQSLITITARDSNGQPLRNVSVRAEIVVGGVRTDFGSLSARNLVTGSDGRASVVYTAPPSPRVSVDLGTVVGILVTPVGTDFNNTSSRTASIRLVAPGTVLPPDDLLPNFVVSPEAPVDNQSVLFVACGDPDNLCAPPNNPVTSYSWVFGDGRTGSGKSTSHAYENAGVYVATLTISNQYGRSGSTSRAVPVTLAAPATPGFTWSPTSPLVNQTVNFNASTSLPAPGRTIQSYDWEFGDGSRAQGLTTTHNYGLPRTFDGLTRTYVVTLTITDDTGRKATKTNEVGLIDPKPPVVR